jgi:V8-like Glu-specific endopeptidase
MYSATAGQWRLLHAARQGSLPPRRPRVSTIQEVQNPTDYPWSTVALIEAIFPSGDHISGTGTVVGPNDVLTAMHVIYNADYGGFATQIMVYPAIDTQPLSEPFGVYTNWGLVDSRVTQFFSSGLLSEAVNDLALIGFTTRIGDATGFLGTLSATTTVTGTVVGYPETGTGMMASDATATFDATANVFDIPFSLGHGASGGPLITNFNGGIYVVGVLSAQGGNGHGWYADLSSPGTANWLTTAIARNDALLLPKVSGSESSEVLNGSSGDEQIWGFNGSDRLIGNGGNDFLVGGNGIDTAWYWGPSYEYRIQGIGTRYITVTDNGGSGDGTDTLINDVERLSFDDYGLALDVEGNAGTAAKILGAVFGSGSLSNLSLIGTALSYVDQGYTEQSLLDIALSARLGSARSNASVVNLLYSNLFGHAPSVADVAIYKGLLDTGIFTQAGLAVIAAESSYNLTNINLVGFESTGIYYW